MLSLPPSVRIFISTLPADMRRSFDGLSALTERVLEQDPFSGHLFVFRNKRGDRVKILYWDRSGFCLWYKRLEEGTFRFPTHEATSYEVEAGELALLLEGIDLSDARRQKRLVRGGRERGARRF
jgi:transposase